MVTVFSSFTSSASTYRSTCPNITKNLNLQQYRYGDLKSLTAVLLLNCYKNISYWDINFDMWEILRSPFRFWGVPYRRFWGRRRGCLRVRAVATGQILSSVLPSNQRRKTDHETQYPDTCNTCTAFVKDKTKIIHIYEHCMNSTNNELRAQRFERSHINIHMRPQNSTRFKTTRFFNKLR